MTIRHFIIAVALLTTTTHAVEWPHWGGPNTDFKLSGTDAFPTDSPYTLRVAWRKTIGTGYSAVSVANGLAVTMYSDDVNDYLIALNAEDGSVRWQHTIGPAYLGHWGSQSGPLSTPLITDPSVIAVSPRGQLFALDLQSGSQIWSRDLVATQDGRTPFWGFTSSPRLVGGRVIMQNGGLKGEAISAYEPATGKPIWSAVSDSVDYQTHGLFKIGLEQHLIFHGIDKLVGLNPSTGEQLWSFDHGGATSASSTSSHPVEISEGRYFVKNSGRGGVLVQVSDRDGRYVAEEVWQTRNIRGTYMYPIHHDGLLFGYSGRILNALDPATGDRIWRSREPGDGLPLIIDDHLVTITKDGRLSVAPVSKDGYSETAGLQVFEDIVWSPASFANGKFYLRSMGEIACVEIATDAAVTADQDPAPGQIPDSEFAQWVRSLAGSSEPSEMIEGLLADHPTFPVIEGDSLAHFVYIGEASDVGIMGDHVGRRVNIPMHRAGNTGLFYYSSRLSPDARITYRFTIDLQTAATDPRNPNEINSLFYGRASYFGMPQWKEADHLAGASGDKGRREEFTFTTAKGDSHQVRVYIPPGYDHDPEQRYPVAYLHDSRRPFRSGMIDVSLDYLAERSVIQPTILVIVPSFGGGGYRALVGTSRREEYLSTFVDELIPYVDKKLRTIQSRQGRVNYGTGRGGFVATFASLRHPDLFGSFAVQSIYWDQTNESEKETVLPQADTLPPYRIYLDWGRYDSRSPIEGNDTRIATERFARALADRGYEYLGGMVNDGAGWASWRNRFDVLFGTLFPNP